MKTNRAGIELIKKWEGLRLKAYKDPIGILTIGYGHTSAAGEPKVKAGMVITQEQAEEILINDLRVFEAGVQKLLKRNPTENQFAAMVSLAFNIGLGNFAKSSVLARFNEGRFTDAGYCFGLWNKAGGKVLQGLINRRADEARLFMSKASSEPVPPPIVPPKRSLWAWIKSFFSENKT